MKVKRGINHTKPNCKLFTALVVAQWAVIILLLLRILAM